MKELDANIKII